MNLTTDNLQRLLTFPFRGPEWQSRLGIAMLVLVAGWIVPVLPWLVLTGYAVQIARRVAIEGREPELPPWTDWSAYLVDGFKVSLVRFVVALPILVFLIGGQFLAFGSAITGGIVGASGGSDMRDLGSLIAVVGSLTGFGLFFVLLPVLLIVGLIVPVPSMHVVVTGEVGAMFRFAEWWRILRADIGAWAMGYLVLIALGLLFNLVTSILTATIVLCAVVPIFLVVYMTYSMLITEVIFAQAYRSSTQKLALPPGTADVNVSAP